MDVERGKAILKEACMNYTEFSQLVGVKPITVRLAFSQKRLSKKMVSTLQSMESEIIRKEEDEEITELEKEHANQFDIETKKKEKLKLKDEIYSILVKYKKD